MNWGLTTKNKTILWTPELAGGFLWARLIKIPLFCQQSLTRKAVRFQIVLAATSNIFRHDTFSHPTVLVVKFFLDWNFNHSFPSHWLHWKLEDTDFWNESVDLSFWGRHPTLWNGKKSSINSVFKVWKKGCIDFIVPGVLIKEQASPVAQWYRIGLQFRRHRRCRFNSRVRKIPWRRAWQPILVFLPGESHGQRSVGTRVRHYWQNRGTALNPLPLFRRHGPGMKELGFVILTSMDVSLSELQELVMDREAWRTAIHGVAKSRTWLSDSSDLIHTPRGMCGTSLGLGMSTQASRHLCPWLEYLMWVTEDNQGGDTPKWQSAVTGCCSQDMLLWIDFFMTYSPLCTSGWKQLPATCSASKTSLKLHPQILP